MNKKNSSLYCSLFGTIYDRMIVQTHTRQVNPFSVSHHETPYLFFVFERERMMSERTTSEGHHRIRTREKHLGLVLIESLRQFASLEDVKNLLRQGAVVNMRDPVTRESVRSRNSLFNQTLLQFSHFHSSNTYVTLKS